MGCYQTKHIKQSNETRNKQTNITSISQEEELKNEILLLRSCLFEVLQMKAYMKSLISMEQDICIIRMKKHDNENLDEILNCYQQNILHRAYQINKILQNQKEVNSSTSILNINKGSSLSTCKNIKSLNTNFNSINDSNVFINQKYDLYQVLRYCGHLSSENNKIVKCISIKQNEDQKDIQGN